MSLRGIINPDTPVDDARRVDLKARIDAFGRKGFSKICKSQYFLLSNQLNGYTTFRLCVADYYDAILKRIEKSKGKGAA